MWQHTRNINLATAITISQQDWLTAINTASSGESLVLALRKSTSERAPSNRVFIGDTMAWRKPRACSTAEQPAMLERTNDTDMAWLAAA